MKQIKFIKDCNDGKFGEIINIADKAAKNAVEQGVAEYVDKIPEIIQKKEIDSIDLEKLPLPLHNHQILIDSLFDTLLAANYEYDKANEILNGLIWNKEPCLEDLENCELQCEKYNLPKNVFKQKYLVKYRREAKKLSNKYKREEEIKTNKEVEEEIRSNITSCKVIDNVLYEQIFDKNKSLFVYLNDHKPKFVENINIKEDTFEPVDDLDAIREKAVILPEWIKDYESEEKLVEEIRLHIHKYCDIPEEFEIFAVHYVLLSWVFDRFNTIPYLSFMGDTGTGKSRCGQVIGEICYKPCKMAGAVTPAPIYRMIKKWNGTLIIEESDFKDSTEKNEVVTILNCGFERGNPVIRCDVNDPSKLLFLPTYCPKIILRRQPFSDKALESRCLTHIMMQTTRKDIPSNLTSCYFKEAEELRQKLLMFRLKNYFKIEPDKILDLDLGDIEPRLKQAASAFALMISNIPSLLERFKIFIKEYNQQLILEREDSMDGLIIKTLFELIDDRGQTEISSKMILDKLKDKEEVNKDMKPTSIGKRLKSLGFETKKTMSVRILILKPSLLESLRARYLWHMADDGVDKGQPGLDNFVK